MRRSASTIPNSRRSVPPARSRPKEDTMSDSDGQMMGHIDETSAAARDAAHWAKSVSRLKVSEVPEGAINLNVSGKRLTGPIQGFGKMWQKTYQIRLPRERV